MLSSDRNHSRTRRAPCSGLLVHALRQGSLQLAGTIEKRSVALISVAESLDTASAACRLVITIMAAVSQWQREAIGERTRDALRHGRTGGERVGNIRFGFRLSRTAGTSSHDDAL